jgi:hypothetical protein
VYKQYHTSPDTYCIRYRVLENVLALTQQVRVPKLQK